MIVYFVNLLYKESDRLEGTAAKLGKIGSRAEELPDGLIVEGGEIPRGGD